MTPSSNHRVEVTDSTDGIVAADAVRFVSVTTSGAGLMYVYADHLGTPQKMTNESQALVWDAVYEPFGEVHSITGSATNNQRFPGQYFDGESGFSYNYFRDYDSSTGRYVQSDPIGLEGGVNTFGYVEGNPVTRLDSYGLYWWNRSAPDTVPVTGPTAQQLQCVEKCLKAQKDWKGKGLLCTGGQEQSGHSVGSKHYSKDAVDIAGQAFNNYPQNDVLICASGCGFTHGWYEDYPGYKKDHWHLQNGPGQGVPPLPPAPNNPTTTP